MGKGGAGSDSRSRHEAPWGARMAYAGGALSAVTASGPGMKVMNKKEMDAKRAKLGSVAGVSLSSGASSTALRGVARSPPPVDVFGHNGTRLFGRFICQGWHNGKFSTTDGAVSYENTSELGFLWGVFYFEIGKWYFGFDMHTFDDWQVVEDIVTKPPPSSWF